MVDQHKFQLVIQFAATTYGDWEGLMALLDAVTLDLSEHEEAVVDGYDFGQGEYNIFIHTNEPLSLFPLAKASVEKHRPDLTYLAGYRDFDKDEYTPIFPPDLKSFKII
jgi:hypothetical protein